MSVRFSNDDERVLITGRRLSLASGGFVPRSHLRQALGGLGADVVDVVLARHRIQPQTFPTQTRGRPITVYAYEEFERAIAEAGINVGEATQSGYAAALHQLQPQDFHRLSLRVLRAAKDLAQPVGFVLRTRLKSKFNTLPASDLSYVMETAGVKTCLKGMSQAYDLDPIVEALEKLETIPEQDTSGTTESSTQEESSDPAEPTTEKTDDQLLKEYEESRKNRPW